MKTNTRPTFSLLLLLLCEIFLLLLFPPSLVFEPTVAAGGDTPSHYMAAVKMRQDLASLFSPVSWMPGNFAGYPLFLHYFPLPFMLTALLSLAVPLQVAFKLVSILAIVPLPAAVYYCLRRLGCVGQAPALGALLSLPFLLMTENSMWGGNISSTLSGEFAFGISFILAVVFTGKIYADAPGKKSLAANGFLEALIALSNGYPLLQAGAGTGYFLLRGGRLRYILCVHALAFGIAGFWIAPLVWRLPWDSPFSHSWHFQSWREIVPPILWPAVAGACIGLAAHARRIPAFFRDFGHGRQCAPEGGPEGYLWWQCAVAALGFAVAPSLGLVDIRFLPFAQIFIVMLGAIGWGKVLSQLPRPNLWVAGFAAAIIALALTKTASLDTWVRWNYAGMEAKPLWRSFSGVNDFLRGSENSPRVVYEHSEAHNEAGSVRAFEMLPHYSGRSTLEGLYMQSSISSPFIFYMQSELTQTPSCPFTHYYYSRLDPERAAKHLRIFNVSQVIAISDNLCNALDRSPDYEPQISFPPYRVYRLRRAPDSYVSPLRFQPFRIPEAGWKSAQFDWFRKSSLQVPLVVASEGSPGDFWKTIPVLAGDPGTIPEIPILDPDREDVRAEAILGQNRIDITTTKPGHPLWIKVSYHPDWKIAKGEGELYPASPTFMLLVPKSLKVTLEFDTRGGIYLFGKILSLLALAAAIGTIAARRRKGPERDEPARARTIPGSHSCRSGLFAPGLRIAAGFTVLAAAALVLVFGRSHRDPLLLYNRASEQFERADEIGREARTPPAQNQERERLLRDANGMFEKCIRRFGDSSVLDHSVYYRARYLTFEKRWDEVEKFLDDFLKTHPETRVYSEILVMMANARLNAGNIEGVEKLFRMAARSWPETIAGRGAVLRLAEMRGAPSVLNEAEDLFRSGDYPDAYLLFRGLSLARDETIRDRSILALAYCCFCMNRWEEASNLFLQWLSGHFESTGSVEAQSALRQCKVIMAQGMAWRGPDSETSPAGRPRWPFSFFNGTGK